jgi:hypothetical protein
MTMNKDGLSTRCYWDIDVNPVQGDPNSLKRAGC